MTAQHESLVDMVPPGLLGGGDVAKLYQHARNMGYSIPAFTCDSVPTCRMILQAAHDSHSPVILCVSYAQAAGIDPTDPVAGARQVAHYLRHNAKLDIPVVLQSETRCWRQLVTWYEELLQSKPCGFGSHAIDLRGECPNEDCIAIARQYGPRLQAMGIWLQIAVSSECSSSSFLQDCGDWCSVTVSSSDDLARLCPAHFVAWDNDEELLQESLPLSMNRPQVVRVHRQGGGYHTLMDKLGSRNQYSMSPSDSTALCETYSAAPPPRFLGWRLLSVFGVSVLGSSSEHRDCLQRS